MHFLPGRHPGNYVTPPRAQGSWELTVKHEQKVGIQHYVRTHASNVSSADDAASTSPPYHQQCKDHQLRPTDLPGYPPSETREFQHDSKISKRQKSQRWQTKSSHPPKFLLIQTPCMLPVSNKKPSLFRRPSLPKN